MTAQDRKVLKDTLKNSLTASGAFHGGFGNRIVYVAAKDNGTRIDIYNTCKSLSELKEIIFSLVGTVTISHEYIITSKKIVKGNEIDYTDYMTMTFI